MGVAATSTTYVLLECRVSGDGTSIQGYVNGTLTGAAITTNIPTALFTPSMGVNSYTADITTAPVFRVRGWGFGYDLVA